MVIPNEELKKFKKLNKLLKEFHGLQEKIKFKDIYSVKLQAILQNSTRKSVGCEAKYRLNPTLDENGKEMNTGHSRWGGSTNYVLTREGIKEEFGYTGEFKCRKMDGGSWWTDYVDNKVVTASLIKCLKKKDVRCESALKEHIQMRKDMLDLHIEDGEYFHKMTLASPIKIQTSVEQLEDDECDEENRPRFETNTIVFKLSGGWGWGGSEVAFVDGEVKWNKGNTYNSPRWEYDKFDDLASQCNFVQFIRYSEPETYDTLVNALNEQIAAVKQYIVDQTAQIEALLAKYGHYLVYSEL